MLASCITEHKPDVQIQVWLKPKSPWGHSIISLSQSNQNLDPLLPCKPPPVNVQNFTSTPPTVTATTTHPLPKQ